MDFTKRLARVAAVATWGSLILSAIGGWIMSTLGANGFTIHLVPFYGWVLAGAVNAAALSVLPMLYERNRHVRDRIAVYRALLLLTDIIFVTGEVAVTGGVTGPFWLLYVPIILFAAVSMPQWQSLALSLLTSGGLILASAIAHRLTGATAGAMAIVAPIFPAVAWFNGTLSASVWDMRRRARQERDELQSRVETLSDALARAAQGDLATSVESLSMDDHESLSTLSKAFSNTLGNLRNLVDQIRSGGEQIAASAGELLATAEEHAASATQQSSAVSETTSTIEELAATAAQIAETAEAVARYAAETLRHAEDGRSAVSASVMAMDTIANRVDGIATRALSLGEKSQEIGRILEVIDDLADQTNLLAL
ncbi:MAG: methyl-accepting chemotaxis protein, partial [Frankiales bacterium]|nr:methyl-accepting chemotaxis protein [Frankiales bacterium]